MYTLNPNNEQVKTHLVSIKRLVGVELVYEGLKKVIGNSKIRECLLVGAAIIGSPFLFFSGFSLKRQRKALNRFYKDLQNDDADLTPEQYLVLKELVQTIHDTYPRLGNITEYSVKNTPFLLRHTVREMKNMSEVFLRVAQVAQEKVDFYNEPKQPGNSQFFEFKSEKQLWENRCKAYKYIA